MDDSSSGASNFLNGVGQVVSGLSPILGTGASLYGQQNASEAVVNANQSAITNQNNTLGNINSLFSPYTGAGAGAMSTLGSTLGTNGQPANYSNFLNMPGYQFAVNQGTQALQRQAAASGTGYTPNTAAAIGQYVTGTAMQDYNTYVQQLMGAGQIGAGATNTLGNLTYNTGANTSQLMANTGQSQAGMYTGMGSTIGGALGGSGLYGYGGASGVSGLVNGVSNLAGGIGNIVSGVSSLFGGNSSGSTDSSGNSNGSYYNPVYGEYGNGFMPGQYGASDYSPYVSTGAPPSGWVDPTTVNGGINFGFGGSDTSSTDSSVLDSLAPVS